ncbi:hypothetical protein KFE25_002319 [Diacronema lutheri]|uniref:Calponin-homology (CH) domain-containing protein n=1 Tax=Diacronema lutheri TaxID=2081491 RepID=A0A8J6C4W2_DIALT|nr:hypothetical protein KFE25_002319 [Diacronema lutheri]
MGQACSLCSPPDKPCDVKLLDCERLGAAPGKPFAAVADTAADGMATPASARTECSDWTAPPTPARDGLDEAGAPAAGAPVDAVNALSAAAEPPAADAGAPAERVPEDGARDAPAAAPPAVAAANAPAAELPAPPPPPLKPKRTIAWSAYAWDDMFTPTLSWVAEATGSALPADALDARAAHAFLRSGEVLCALANALQPGIVSAVDHAHAPFAHRENIARFLTAAERLGVAGHETFQTHDLYDGTDMKQVCICLAALGRASHGLVGFDGPAFDKPMRAKLGAHKLSAHVVRTGSGLWGTPAGQHRPVGAFDRRLVRTASATGYIAPGPPSLALQRGVPVNVWSFDELASFARGA